MIRRRSRGKCDAPSAPSRTSALSLTCIAPRRVLASDHLILRVGSGTKCRCGQPASNYMRCRVCKSVLATCGGHKATAVEERDDHEFAHKEKP